MEAKAIARHIRQSPRKMRLVADLIRGQDVNDAYAILKFDTKKAARPIEKILRSAVANAMYKADEQGERLDVPEVCLSASTSLVLAGRSGGQMRCYASSRETADVY